MKSRMLLWAHKKVRVAKIRSAGEVNVEETKRPVAAAIDEARAVMRIQRHVAPSKPDDFVISTSERDERAKILANCWGLLSLCG
jgi:hypothetical protein